MTTSILPVDSSRSSAQTVPMSRRYRCPHCRETQQAVPDPARALTLACTSCNQRFRIPKATAPRRTSTSNSQKRIKQLARKEAAAYRSESDQARLSRIVSERRFAEYDILHELGRGGMGVVYSAFHRRLKRMIALKLILPNAATRDTLIKRFQREAELHTRLRHPNIVHVYDHGERDGVHFIAMDYITGTQLSKMVGSPEFSLRARVDIGRQISDALAHAHSHGVIHRDIKPDNIIIDAGWKAHLVDFGISKPTDMAGQENLTQVGLAIGTPHYMAPEQFQPKLGDPGPAADIYSLGAVLYHTLAGRPPFEADTAHVVLIKVATEQPDSLAETMTPSNETIPRDLSAIIEKTLRKDPRDRYTSAATLAADLNNFLSGEEVIARPRSESERLRRRLRFSRDKIRVFAMAAGILLVMAGAFASTAFLQRGEQSEVIELIEESETSVDKATTGDVVHRIQALVDAKITLADTKTRIEQKTQKDFITSLYAGGAAALAIILLVFFLIVRPFRKIAAADELSLQPAPNEMGLTADEVSTDTTATA